MMYAKKLLFIEKLLFKKKQLFSVNAASASLTHDSLLGQSQDSMHATDIQLFVSVLILLITPISNLY